MKLLQDNKIKNSINDVNKLEPHPYQVSPSIQNLLHGRHRSSRTGTECKWNMGGLILERELSTAHLSYRDTARHSFNHSRRVSMGNQPHTPMTMTAQARGADRYRLLSPSVSYFGTAGNGLHFIQVW